MAEGTNIIATRETANDKKPGSYTSDLKRCVTYSSAISAGFGVRNEDRYTSNKKRLVRLNDLYNPGTFTIILEIDVRLDANLYNVAPLTLNRIGKELKDNVAASAGPLSYAREVEATEVEYDTSKITPKCSSTSVEETNKTTMTLSTLDEVLQSVQEFEEQEKLLGASGVNPNMLVQITLTKSGSSTNLLDSSTYGPASVIPNSDGSKTVTYTLRGTKTYNASSDNGSYTLSYPGTKSNYLMNARGIYPDGGLYAGLYSSSHSQTITVSSAGTYKFKAAWQPAPTYTCRVRFSIDNLTSQGADIRFVEFRSFTGTIYSSRGAALGDYNLDNGDYDIRNLNINIDESTNRQYYYIDLWTGKTLPYFIRVIMPMIILCKENTAGEFEARTMVQNTMFTGTEPSIPGTKFYTIDKGNYVYSIDLILDV